MIGKVVVPLSLTGPWPTAFFEMVSVPEMTAPFRAPANEIAFAAMKLVEPAKLQAKNTAGDTIDAWLYPPVDFDPA